MSLTGWGWDAQGAAQRERAGSLGSPSMSALGWQRGGMSVSDYEVGRPPREPGSGVRPQVPTCRLHRGSQLPVLLGRHKLAIGRTQCDPPITPLHVEIAADVPGGVRKGQAGLPRVPGPRAPGKASLGRSGGALTWWRQWTARPQWLSASSTSPCGCGRRTFWCRGRSPAGKSPGRSPRPDWLTGPYLRGELPTGTGHPHPELGPTRSPALTHHCQDPSASTSGSRTPDPRQGQARTKAGSVRPHVIFSDARIPPNKPSAQRHSRTNQENLNMDQD